MLLIKVLLAHALGDFVLQPNKWVKHKEKHQLKSPYLYIHTLIHGLLLGVLLAFNIKYIGLILTVTLAHLFIDALKIIKPIKNERYLFFIDQALHLLVILVTVNHYQPFDITDLFNNKNLLLVLAIVCLTAVVSIVMKVLVSKWSADIYKKEKTHSSLQNAGTYIGMLERLFIFVFIICNQWEGIGFLLAAKSIFRFGDLTNAKDRKLTEYILIGTLLSFGFAILIGKVYLYIFGTL